MDTRAVAIGAGRCSVAPAVIGISLYCEVTYSRVKLNDSDVSVNLPCPPGPGAADRPRAPSTTPRRAGAGCATMERCEKNSSEQ
ncbi:hypothetical protein H4W79_000946 [Nocardiopsis terrae]|uniref:Uncharacterized protein n=1 Tax=Nocardiopsis terrae TaxID=372655 RepID=A0ABR9HCI2_9ACTN|nr:hypothetical protein [Nocardiopsis terrae]